MRGMLGSRDQNPQQAGRREVRDRSGEEAGVDRVGQRRGHAHGDAEEVWEGGQIQRHQVKESAVMEEVLTAGVGVRTGASVASRRTSSCFQEEDAMLERPRTECSLPTILL